MSIYGTFTLGDTEGVSKHYEEEAQKYVLQARSDAISVIDEMNKLVAKGLSPDTPVWIWNRQIRLDAAPEREEVTAEVHEKVLEVMMDEVEQGKLSKSKDSSWGSRPERVQYDGKTGTGVTIQYRAIPPGCRVEERETIIPATPERIEKKKVLICQGPNGETEEVIE